MKANKKLITNLEIYIFTNWKREHRLKPVKSVYPDEEVNIKSQ